jgi:large subunit ribosomal protein L23
MSQDPRHYDVIVAPVITEKATIASEQKPRSNACST